MIRLFAKSISCIYVYVYMCVCVCVCIYKRVRIGGVYRLVLARKDSIALKRKSSRSIRIRWNNGNPMDEIESIDPTSPRTFQDNGNRMDIGNLKITGK